MLLLTLLLLTSCLSARIDEYFYSGIDSSSPQPYKEAIADKMKDPDSVKFRRMKFYKPAKNGHRIIVLCGELNAKNSLGGYVGYDAFVSNGYHAITPTARDSISANQVIECLCRDGEMPARCK